MELSGTLPGGCDRIVVPGLMALGIGSGTVLPILRAMRRTGGSGLTFHKSRKDSWERGIGTVVGALGGVHITFGLAYGIFGPTSLGVVPPSPLVFWTGAILYLVGVAVVVAAQSNMGSSWRIGIDHGSSWLVTHGLYSVVRNPIYVGVIIMGASTVLSTPSWISVSGAFFYWLFIQIQIRFEERHLLAAHGMSYERYMGEVGRLFPLPSRRLNAFEQSLLMALGEAVLPGTERLAKFQADSRFLVERTLADGPRSTAWAVRIGLRIVSLAAWAYSGSTLRGLSAHERERVLERMLNQAPRVLRLLLRALVALVKNAYLERHSTQIGSRTYPAIAKETFPWMRQMKDGALLNKDEEVEVDVVIVGTGAGGASAAYELASRGHAVLLLEEGRYFGRHEFAGQAMKSLRTMFRDQGMTLSYGNAVMPVWTGVTVGGSTTVNSGTCYRAPEHLFESWRQELGLDMFSSQSMAPYFERVESILGVEESPNRYQGGSARKLALGASKLGVHGEPIRRNAPGCDGQGRCMWGCPSGAKRSTDVSYVPMALEKGAVLYSSTRAEKILTEGARARGIVARTKGGAQITVRARATVLACGSLMTPVLLQRNGLANRSGWVGRNLSIHPAAPVLALFDDQIDMQSGIPQSYAVEEWSRQGLMIEESGNPPEVIGVALPLIGSRFSEVFEKYERIAQFGYMIKDTSRGRVVPGAGGRPRISYSLNEADTRLLQMGCEKVSELFLEAGARSVFPAVRGFTELQGRTDLERLRGTRLEAGDFQLSAVHPLGTARMGVDPRASVVNTDQECHDVRDLYIMDGSAVPTALGVNPQVTIMAMATRAAEKLHEKL